MLCILSIIVACTRQASLDKAANYTENPESTSDMQAVALADQVMQANGGIKNWQNLTYVKWNFFGSRRHIWNKKTDDYVIHGIKDDFVIKGNLHGPASYLALQGVQVSHADSLSKYSKKAISMWNNDAYWLFMPFKLLDQGVHLKSMGEGSDLANNSADKIEMTFTAVGDTPDNKYIIYIDKETKRVSQWDFYVNRGDEEARFQIPWTGYQNYDGVMLASDRGDQYKLTEIATGDSLAYYFN